MHTFALLQNRRLYYIKEFFRVINRGQSLKLRKALNYIMIKHERKQKQKQKQNNNSNSNIIDKYLTYNDS